MAERNCPIEVFHPVFFTPPRRADVAFVWYRPPRMRGQPVNPHTSSQRAPRRRANGCADVRFLTCAVVQPSTLRSQAALGSGFSLQAAFWYQNAMLARVVADCAASRRLFMLRIKKSSLIRFVAPPFQNANSSLVCILVFFFSRYMSRYAGSKFDFLTFVVATIVATAAIQAALSGSRRFLAAVFVSFAFSTRRFSPPNRIGAQISKILS